MSDLVQHERTLDASLSALERLPGTKLTPKMLAEVGLTPRKFGGLSSRSILDKPLLQLEIENLQDVHNARKILGKHSGSELSRAADDLFASR